MAREEDIQRLMRQVDEVHRLAKETHTRLYEPPPEGGPSFMQRAEETIKVFERSSWAAKLLVRLILGAGALAAAMSALKTYAQGLFKG